MNASLQPQAKLPSFVPTPARSHLLQRKCACGGTPGPSGECEECRRKQLQRKAQYSDFRTRNEYSVPPIVHEVLRSPGQLLDSATRTVMGTRFGHDFSQVRVHTGDKAEESARAVDALAYTMGRDIVFGARQHAPFTKEGQTLMAHELTHVVQQSGGKGFSSLTMGRSNDQFEQEADKMADIVVNSAHGSTGQIGLVNSRSEPYAIRRLPATSNQTKQEKQEPQLRQLARLPRKALEQWKNLKVNERDTVLREMTRYYGKDFTNDFTEYAFLIKKPDLSGAVLQSTAKELTANGYRNAGDVWVHPSGREVFLLSPPKNIDPLAPGDAAKPAPTPSTTEEPDEIDLNRRCIEPCTLNTEDKDGCDECCARIPSEDGECRRACEYACAQIYAD